MTWYYKGKPFKLLKGNEYFGFVYCVTGPTKSYIGKKKFYRNFSLKPLKGRKRRRRFHTQSDWQDYWGSNKALLADLELLGPRCFKREILYLCKALGDMTYLELKLQIEYEVLLHPADWYNDWIIGKVTRKSLTDALRPQ